MASKSESSLRNFYVFCAEWGPKEGEEEKKILYYHPDNASLDEKVNNIGLSEAIVKFAETFTDKPCEAVHTQKTRQVLFEPEKDFWMVITVQIPVTARVKENQTYYEYHEDDVKDSVLQSIMRTAYNMFCMFNGTIQYNLDKADHAALKLRLSHFFDRYLLTLKLEHCDVLDVFNGLSFLPLDKNMFLRIQCMMNLIEANFSHVRYTIFLYNDQLVWSGLEQDDIRTMYKYLVTSLFVSYHDQEVNSSRVVPSAHMVGRKTNFGKFITGPPDLGQTNNLGKVPKIFVNNHVKTEECYLVVYRALSASVCLLVDSNYGPLNLEFFQQFNDFLGPQLSTLASEMGDQYSRRSISESLFKYIYFNHMNLAQKTTIHLDTRHLTPPTVPQDVLHFLSDMNSDFTESGHDGETIMKTTTDYWIVGKKSDQREFYVVINNKSANLIEINEEVKTLCENHFNNIFFLE